MGATTRRVGFLHLAFPRDHHEFREMGGLLPAIAVDLLPLVYTSLFVVDRLIGWIAHAIEQYELGQLIRPRARLLARCRMSRPSHDGW